MSIVVDRDTKLVVSGLTGREGSFHGLRNRDYGTDLVAGVTPGKGGQEVGGVPVFDSIKESVEEAGANTSMIFVPARFAAPAIDEAIAYGPQGAKVERIAAAAGCTTGALYTHFRSKDDLFVAVYHEGITRFGAEAAALRNLVITALRLAGVTNIAAALRHHARYPYRPLATYKIT